jgi:hypothetical protein
MSLYPANYYIWQLFCIGYCDSSCIYSLSLNLRNCISHSLSQNFFEFVCMAFIFRKKSSLKQYKAIGKIIFSYILVFSKGHLTTEQEFVFK